ncbi:MAG TPA: glycerophosphodiester phosphodiesterase family protein [Verrucomicrobiota bacterium]|nr:glycerophosphodiester phosphodiesterase family protein [Verrucomicrobiota bacterium]HNT13816.1 glycerophosphodiester phosphodiesterase family protein [Verrucomicrobiota bacterium]
MLLRKLVPLLCWQGAALLLTAQAAEVLSIAHRGNSRFAPENTVAAFMAAEGKADLVETDVYVSADGYLVIMHDSTVDRTTDGTGPITGKTLAQIKQLDAGSWFGPQFVGERVPTLEEMITNTLPFATPLIEHKQGPASAYLSELQRLEVVDQVVVQSFDWNFLSAIHALAPDLRLAALGSGAFTEAKLNAAIAAGAGTIAWERSAVTPAVLDLVHNAGLKLFVWTVDSISEIRYLVGLGVDGIISNDPGAVRNAQLPPDTNGPVHLADDLFAYWNFDDGLTNAFATTIADDHGTNNAALIRNDGASHWFQSPWAQLGGALKLEGANAYVTLPQNSGMDIGTNQLSLSIWLNLQNLPAQLAGNYGAIFDSAADAYVLYLDKPNNELRFKITTTDNHAARPGIAGRFLPTNQWIHIVATYNGQAFPGAGEAAIYLNGELMDAHVGNDGGGSAGLTGNIKPGQAAAMGREGPTGANYFTGYVDDFAIWRRALNPHEVQYLFQSGTGGQSLGDLLLLPPPTVSILSIETIAADDTLEIVCAGAAPLTTFRLLRASQPAGAYTLVPEATPVALGQDQYRFRLPIGTNATGFFRVEAW